ncbi:MAG: hypothetical protein KatS3mg105_3148 [Gemmatales bacterium]|nr:MAG: hypothetical protein KatS3mg105_3148 [Gemmatales bacterium]
MSIAVITCYYNPCGYRLVREKYWRFRECLGRCDFFCIEASWNRRWETDAAFHITAHDNQLMWQKERLLNILIDKLPSRYDRIVWIDADLILLDPDWLERAGAMLDKYPVGQPWSRFHILDSKGCISRSMYSASYKRHHQEITQYASPGLLWAARREVLADGLIDCHVIGGGDSMQLVAWLGPYSKNWTQEWMFRAINPEWRGPYLEQAQQALAKVQGQIGYCDGEVVHLYHGTRDNRKYVDRVKYLTDYCFDPTVHIKIGKNGLWSWTDKAHPEMVAKVKAYFNERLEDG